LSFKKVFFDMELMILVKDVNLQDEPTNKNNFPDMSNLIKKFLLSIDINGTFCSHNYCKNPKNAIGVYGTFTPDVRLFIGGLII
jgi:hypothetical protein